MDSSSLIIILFLAAHTGALLWWGGKTSKAVTILEGLAGQHDRRIRTLELRESID